MKKALLLSLCLITLIQLRAQNSLSVFICTAFLHDGTPVTGTTIDVTVNAPGIAPNSMSIEGVDCATFTYMPIDDFPAGATLAYAGFKDSDDGNGVTILDLVAMGSHILGISPLAPPYATLAADINRSGSITILDIVESRKLLLGIYQEFPNNLSWRFYQENCAFPNNPFSGGCPPIPFEDLLASPDDTLHLIGVKTGDVDSDANPQGPFAGASIFDSTLLQIPDVQLLAGVPTTVEIKLGGILSLHGLHAEFLYDANTLHFNGPSHTLNFTADSYGVFPGKITAAAVNSLEPMAPGEVLMKLNFTANTTVQLSDVFSLNPSILHSLGALGNIQPLGIKLGSTLEILTGVTGAALEQRLAAPHPNPFMVETTFTLELDASETVRLEVFDASGQRRYLSENRLPSGSHLLNLPQEAMAPGTVGYYRLQAGNKWASGKLIRL